MYHDRMWALEGLWNPAREGNVLIGLNGLLKRIPPAAHFGLHYILRTGRVSGLRNLLDLGGEFWLVDRLFDGSSFPARDWHTDRHELLLKQTTRGWVADDPRLARIGAGVARGIGVAGSFRCVSGGGRRLALRNSDRSVQGQQHGQDASKCHSLSHLGSKSHFQCLQITGT